MLIVKGVLDIEGEDLEGDLEGLGGGDGTGLYDQVGGEFGGLVLPGQGGSPDRYAGAEVPIVEETVSERDIGGQDGEALGLEQ